MTTKSSDDLQYNGRPRSYITVYQPIAGWKAMLLVWDDEYQFHEPWQTDYVAYKTKAEAIKAAKAWAEMEELMFFDDCPDKTEDASDKSVTEQLLEIIPNAEVIDLD